MPVINHGDDEWFVFVRSVLDEAANIILGRNDLFILHAALAPQLDVPRNIAVNQPMSLRLR